MNTSTYLSRRSAVLVFFENIFQSTNFSSLRPVGVVSFGQPLQCRSVPFDLNIIIPRGPRAGSIGQLTVTIRGLQREKNK